MIKVIKYLAFSVYLLVATGNSYGLPYSTDNSIQIYKNIPDSLLSSTAKECLEDSKNKGVMSQLSQNIGCSNFITAEKVCSCVDKAFDEKEVSNFLNSPKMNLLDDLFSNSYSVGVDKLKPAEKMNRAIGELNIIYDEMGLGGCSFDSKDNYSNTIKDRYVGMKKENSNLLSNNLQNQHQLFNNELRKLKSENPTKEELIKIAKEVSELSGEEFFLEKRLLNDYSETNETEVVFNQIKKSIIKDYVSIHLNEIKAGVKPEHFDIKRVSSQLAKDKGRQGCKEMLSLISIQKESDLNEKISSNFATFFPESYLGKTSEKEKSIIKRGEVESAISRLKDSTSMYDPEEHELDILYCHKYNEYKMRSEEISKNKDLKDAMAKLEILRERKLIGVIADSNSFNSPEVKTVRDEISKLEEEIMSNFNLSKEGLEYAYMGLKIWKVDKRMEVDIAEDGSLIYTSTADVSGKDNRTLSERMNNRRRSIERSRKGSSFSRFSSLKSSSNPSSSVAGLKAKSVDIKSRNNSESLRTNKPAKLNTASKNAPSQDNYFQQKQLASTTRNNSNMSTNKNVFENSRRNKDFNRDNSVENYISERINKLEQDKIKTEKALTDELASTKESLELAKLREELRAQSEEIAKLTKKREESPVVVDNTSNTNSSSPVSFRSPLSSGLSNSSTENSSGDPLARSAESAGGNRAAASSTLADQNVSETSSPGSTSGGGASSSISNNSSQSDETSISGISLSSLKSFGDDVQLVDNSSLGEIRPIIVDASFEELSEDQKRERIEELLETALDDEVYIEFPDGKVLKFSKKDEAARKNGEIKKSKKEVKKIKRKAFSYETLKEIIDSNKE